jgi:hypothetical protein
MHRKVIARIVKVGDRFSLSIVLWPWPTILGSYASKNGAKAAAKRQGLTVR